MKKSKAIPLLILTAALSSCHQKANGPQWEAGERHVYLRSDTSASYTAMAHHGSGSGVIRYWAFRPYGDYYGGSYYHTGYYSDAITEGSNYGSNSAKATISRGGFGGGHATVSS